MHKVNISVTVSRTDINNQFKGIITFKNENKETSFDYLCTDPEGEQINLEFSTKNEKFGIKGIPSRELFETLSDNQKLIFAMSIEPISLVISNTRSLSLSHNSTRILRMYGGDASGEMNFPVEIGEKEYFCIFK